MLYVCVRDVMDVVFSVCIVRCAAVGAPVWEVRVFRHADVVCLLMLVEAYYIAGLMTLAPP